MSAIEKLINVCENRQVADTAQAELTTLRAELAQAQASRQQLDEAHKEASHRLFHAEAELAQAKADYQVALKQGAEQARIAGNWQVDHIKLEAELEECRGEREQLSYRKKMLLKDMQEVVSKLEAERDTLKGLYREAQAHIERLKQ